MLASVLLGTDPPWLPTPLLVRTAALFGISEGSTRTALSRLVSGDEAVAEDGGYRLVGRLVARQARQTASRRAEVRSWDGTWELATVDGEARRAPADRAALRQAMVTLRLAELREGVWGRPDNLDPERSSDAAEVVERWCVVWRGARPRPVPPVDSLWDVPGWAADADDLRGQMQRLVGPLEAGDLSALAKGFVTSAAVLRLLQADPLLPSELLSDDWPGRELRTAYDHYDAAYRTLLHTWFVAEP